MIKYFFKKTLFSVAAMIICYVGLNKFSGELKAQTCCIPGIFEVINTHWSNSLTGIVHIGKQDNPGACGDNLTLDYPTTKLVFGRGNCMQNGDDQGYFSMNVEYGAFRMGRVYNCPTGNNPNAGRAIVVNCDGVVGISHTWKYSYHMGHLSHHNGNYNGNIRLNVNGQVLSTGYLTQSDRRYKTEIEPLNNFENLFKLNSVQYKPSSEATREQFEFFKASYKDNMPEDEFNKIVASYEQTIADENADNSLHFGFIAQDLQAIFPDLVVEDKLGFLSVNYVGLIPVIVDAIKEQQKTIEAQQNKINELLKEKGRRIEQIDATNDAMLYQNHPNPFSEQTEIKFYIPDNARNAFICVYDLTGSQLMKLDITSRGNSSVIIRGSQLTAGMYLYSLLVDGKEVDTKRMILTNNN